MRMLRSGENLSHFIDRVGGAQRRLLLFDYDGTLAPFRVEPSEATLYPDVRDVLSAMLEAKHTRIVVISGRSIRDLRPLLRFDLLPEIWGSHGWERLCSDGTYSLPEIDQRAREGLTAALRWIQELKLTARYDQKPVGLSLHWRGLEATIARQLHEAALLHWMPLAQEAGLVVQEFDGGIELRVPGRDKGFAVNTILAEMEPNVVAAYLGDDLTDEDAFRAIMDRGLGILVRGELRTTAADCWLRPPEELLEFLVTWHRICVSPDLRFGGAHCGPVVPSARRLGT